MDRLGMEEDIPIEHKLVSKAIENAQGKVEGHNFDIRKHLLEYDDVMNQQRQVVYGYRRQILAQEGLREMVKDFATEVAEDIVYTHIEEKTQPDEWNMKAFNESIYKQFGVTIENGDLEGVSERDALAERLTDKAWKFYQDKAESVGEELLSQVEKIFMLHMLDNLWKDHLLSMDHLKGGIGLRGYAQKNPLSEYKKEGFNLFVDMIFRLKSDVVERLYKVQVEAEKVSALEPQARQQNIVLSRGEVEGGAGRPKTIKRATTKVGRNEPCPCGSGKKYKKCCGR
jgi:preprotein translocase subunit SecA